MDTNKPFTVITEFITSDGTDKGDLIEVKRTYQQNNKTIVGGSMTDSVIKQLKKDYNDHDQFTATGGLKSLGRSISNMVLVMTLWSDPTSNMAWLDSIMPDDVGKPPRKGTVRGPCPVQTLDESIKNSKNATVVFGDLQVTSLSTPGPKIQASNSSSNHTSFTTTVSDPAMGTASSAQTLAASFLFLFFLFL